jgi:hypothetical protein
MILQIAYRSAPHMQRQTAEAIEREFPNPLRWRFSRYDLDKQEIHVQIGDDTLTQEQQAWLNKDKRIVDYAVRENVAPPFPGRQTV